MASPCMAVPRPGGRPAPSGPMLMSHGAISAGAMGCPNCGACADAAFGAAMSIAAQTARLLSIHIGRLPLLVDAPACDRVVVVDAPKAAVGGELRARRLHHAGVVGGAALEHGRPAIPLPSRAEAHRRL